MDHITITDNTSSIVNNPFNKANALFGYVTNPDGSVQILPSEDDNGEDRLQKAVEQEIINNQKNIQEIRKANPNSKLSNEQLKELFDDFNGGDFLIF